MPAFVDPQSGERFENVPPEQAGEAQKRYGLVPAEQYEKEQASGGLANELQTVPETALATGAVLGEQVSQFAGDVDPMGNPINTVAPVSREAIAPSAFTPEAKARREQNPKAALAGTLLAEAPTLLIPGAGEIGWAARLGLGAAASGGIAEAGQAAITGQDFSPARAAFYGVVGEALGGLAAGGIGRLMRTTGKEAPSALEVALRKATNADADDAIGELSTSPFKASKLADNAPELVDRAGTELSEHVASIEQRLGKAEDRMFSKANVKRAISGNLEAQQDVVLTQAARLDDMAGRLVEDAIDTGHAGFARKVKAGVDELMSARSAPDMYLTARKVVQQLADEAPPTLPGYAQEAISGLDDTLADATTWGPVAKNYAESKAARAGRQEFSDGLFDGVSVDHSRVKSVLADNADRTAFNAYLDSAEAAAKASSDPTLRKAVDRARSAVASADDAAGSKVLRDTFSEEATNFVTDRVIKQGSKYALGAVGIHGGPLGALIGAGIGETVGPAVANAVRPAVKKAFDVAAPFFEDAAGKFSAEGISGALGRLSRSAATQVQTAGRSLSNAALRASQSTIEKIGAPTMSVGIARFMGHHENLRDAFAEKKDVLTRLDRDPMAIADELAESLDGLQAVAPQVHSGIVAKTYQALSFIRTKIPSTIGVSLSSPSGIPPSQLAVRQFALYYSGATDPSSVIEDVKNNRVRTEQLEALDAVWPEVYTDLKASVLEGMSTSKPTPAQRMRMDILFDFGPALDSALTWDLALVADKARATQEQNQAAARGTISKNLSSRVAAANQPEGLAALSNPQTENV